MTRRTPLRFSPRAQTARRRQSALAACALALGCTLTLHCGAQSSAWPQAGGAAASPAGLKLGLSPGTHLVYEARPWRPDAGPLTLAADALPPPQHQLGLEFRSDASDKGPRSLFRVQLAGDSVLHFRPRRGGLAVTYRSQF